MYGQSSDGPLDIRPEHLVRGLGHAKPGSVGTFSRAQNRAILIVAVTTASISLAIAMVSLRWFLTMKRSFRHHLILMLIISDSFKALWYFLSPVVTFTRGEISSSSAFSQASGFLLAMGVEAADLSILFIALHTTLYVFRPPQRPGNGGLYRYRYWLFGCWLLLPLLAASLAFTNRSGDPYVTFGTISYLPKRPFWYRLALAWIPRYIILVSIIVMYSAIYIYVKVKFRGFGYFKGDDFCSDRSSMPASTSGHDHPGTSSAGQQATWADNVTNPEKHNWKPFTSPISDSPADLARSPSQSQTPDDIPQWDKIDFITTSPLVNRRISQLSLGIEAADFACDAGAKSNEWESGLSQYENRSESTRQATRNDSTAPTLNTNLTSDTAVTAGTGCSSPTTMRSRPTLRRSRVSDQLTMTRIAIHRQLRFLFIYPLIYVLLWVLPFVQHCLSYTDYYTAHPPFWLNICTTCILALQAGVDCAIFSWRERPWRRIDGPSILSGWAFRNLGARFSDRDGRSENEEGNGIGRSDLDVRKINKSKRDSTWWEEEGKKRKDSVWLGTDTVNDIVRMQTRQSE